jgi:hypothetical protein
MNKPTDLEIFEKILSKIDVTIMETPDCKFVVGDNYDQLNMTLVTGFLCSPQFAKLFWPDELMDEYDKEWGQDWEYHLKQMVVRENPLDYMRQFIES